MAPSMLGSFGVKKIVAALSLIVLSQASRADVAADILEEMNFARVHPKEYARNLPENLRPAAGEAISFLMKARPVPPIAPCEPLARAAERHLADQGPRGTHGHTGTDGSQPGHRMARYGRCLGSVGENISYGMHDAKTIVATLIIDRGVSGRGHRKNIFNPCFSVVGIAFGYHARHQAMCVIDFAGGFIEKAPVLSNK